MLLIGDNENTENKDKNLQETALRETFEEVGVKTAQIEIIRQISILCTQFT